MSDMVVMLAITDHGSEPRVKPWLPGKSCLWFIMPALNQEQILRRPQLGEADAGLLNESLESTDRLDLGASIERTIQRPATANCTASRSSSGLGPTTPLSLVPRIGGLQRPVEDILVREGLCAFNPSKGHHDQFSTLSAKLPQSHRRSGIP
jgi:hypothetical protein